MHLWDLGVGQAGVWSRGLGGLVKEDREGECSAHGRLRHEEGMEERHPKELN